MDPDILVNRIEETAAENETQKHQFSSMSLDSGTYNQDPRFQLHLVQKKQTLSSRPIIPATKFQRLSYYRTYTTSTYRTDTIAKFSWTYCLVTVFQSLPQTFLHIFLASYAPKEHLFLRKMVAICYGAQYLWVLTSFLRLLLHIDVLICLLHYYIVGIFNKNPWNRCDDANHYDIDRNITIHCYNITEFVKKFDNNTVTHNHFAYQSANETFLVAPIDYYRKYGFQKTEHIVQNIAYVLSVWVLIAILESQITKKYFWVTLNCTQWSVNAVDLTTYSYLLWTAHYLDKTYLRHVSLAAETSQGIAFWPEELAALPKQFVSAPPVVHVLTARSTQPIIPSQDSSVIIISNAALYIFRGILNNAIQQFCKYRLLKTDIDFNDYNIHASFYLVPMFYSSFYLGNIFSIIYFGINLISELLTASVTYRCFIDAILYEWKFLNLKRWMLSVAVISVGALTFIFVDRESRYVLFLYGLIISTWIEVFSIYLVYPLGRLVDDFTFHYGYPPTKLRIMLLRLVPIYYLMDVTLFIWLYWKGFELMAKGIVQKHYRWSWMLFVVPSILGAAFMICKHVIRDRRPWTHLFRPLRNWGPTEFQIRQLRKQFDSRSYVRSEAPKLLSRYLIAKRDSNVYKLDVRYDFTKMSTPHVMEVRYQNERKKKK